MSLELIKNYHGFTNQNSKYMRWYKNIIQNALVRNLPFQRKERIKNPETYIYVEKHHIIPKAIGGSNNKSNIVTLTAREHFIVHICLCKIVTKEYRSGMYMAVQMFKKKDKFKTDNYFNSRLYGLCRKEAMGTPTNKKCFYNPETKKQIICEPGNEPEGFFLGGAPKFKNGHPDIGKKWYMNESTGEKRRFFEDEVPSGWISKFKIHISEKTEWWHDPNTGFEYTYKLGQQPEHFIKGRSKGKMAGELNGCYGKKCHYHKDTMKIKFFVEGEAPEDYIMGTPSTLNKNHVKGRKRYHNPVTKEEIIIFPDEHIPEGFVSGGLVRGNKWYYNPNNPNEYRKLYEYEVPDGWIQGRSTSDKTKGKWYRNPETNEKIRLLDEKEIPKGFVKGRGPRESKKRNKEQ